MKKHHLTATTRTGLFFLLLLLVSLKGISQQLLTGSNMEDSTAWTIYHQGSAVPASYEFNHTAQTPAKGLGGCLRVTATERTNILFWQKLALIAGKSYVVDGAVKTGTVASFWCELYLSTVAPVENADYSPNNNGDVVRGFSTWAGCGPGVDGSFVMDACTGKKIYTVPGNAGDTVEIYFALKTGSIANPFPAPLDILIDELSVTMINDYSLLSTREGTIDAANRKVVNVSPFITVESFRGGLHAAPTATIDIVDTATGISIPGQDTTLLSGSMAVKVQGLNGSSLYPIELRPVGTQNNIVWVAIGFADPFNSRVWLSKQARVAQLQSAITVAPYASFVIVNENDSAVQDADKVTSDMKIIVSAENGNTRTYSIKTLPLPMLSITKYNYQDTVETIRYITLRLKGHSVVTVTGADNPLKGGMIDLQSDDVWLYFPNIKPSVFYEKYLSQIMVNGEAAVMDLNVRLEQYLQGTVIISHSADYKALQVYTGENLSGTSLPLGNYTYHRAAELGGMHDAIQSFRLKKGYMATFAKDELGTGYSRVYIADKEDIIINKLPKGLYNDVSFVRVIPWRWVAKKGWTSGRSSAEALNCSWQYDWDNAATSGLNVEYIPMRHNRWWNSFENINNKRKSTHALGFNEPERTDQANMSVDDAIALWPELMKSGLRLGSPCPSDGGLDWLYRFIDRCDALNYRVDFIAMHWYMGGQTPQQFYNRLKAIHERTGRPIWITEWNNGANWTCCKPTYPQQAEAIGRFLHMLDTTSFVERYSLYEWVEDTRFMFYKAPTLLTPAGEVYRDKVSPMAYNADKAFYRDYVQQPIEYVGPGAGFNHGKSLAADIDNDADLDIIYSGVDPYTGGILKNDGNGNFTNTGQAIPGLFAPTINAGDLDGDGDLDIILTGWDRANSWAAYSRILRNDGAGNFTLETPPAISAPCGGIADVDNNALPDYFMIGNGTANKFYFQQAGGFLPPVNGASNGNNIQDPDANWVDIDNDQDIDFIVQAWNRTTNRRYTQVYKNNGDGTFTEQAIPFKQKHWGSAQFADIDHDGDLDLLLNGDGDGNSDGGSHEIFRLYINDGTGNFTEGATFRNYRQNANGKGSSFVDWDNDGDYDILLTGWSSTENREVTNIYLNDGAGAFTRSPESDLTPGVNRSTIELGDFNNDGRTDVLLNGNAGRDYNRNVAFLYTNESDNINTIPLAPSGLQAVVTGDSIQLSWQAGADAETHVNALSYNIYVRDASGKYYIFPNAHISTGRRMTTGLGNAYLNLGWKLHGLPAGVYTWGVQTIDAAYAGSAFEESTFAIQGATITTAARTAAVQTELTGNTAISVYPNPVTDRLTIQLGNEGGQQVRITVTDAYGRVVNTATVKSTLYTFNMENAAAGVYMVQIQTGEKTVIKKILKK